MADSCGLSITFNNGPNIDASVGSNTMEVSLGNNNINCTLGQSGNISTSITESVYNYAIQENIISFTINNGGSFNCTLINGGSINLTTNGIKGDPGTTDYNELQNKPNLDNYITSTALTNGLATKVDKVAGKDLSTNDLTSSLKENYDGAHSHSLLTSGNPHSVTKADLGLNNVPNIDCSTTSNIEDSLNKRFVTDSDITLLLNTSGVNSGDQTAETVTYTESLSVKDVLDQLLYVTPLVTLSGGSSYEKGETVASVALTWTINKDIISQSLNNGIGSIIPVSTRNYTHSSQSITSNRTYTITVNDGTNNAISSTSVVFYSKRYWGVSENTSLNDAQIIALSSEFSTSRVQTRTFDCTGGKYFYFAFPSSFGTPSFTVNGLSFSDVNLTTQNFTNSSGYTESYYVYRCNNLQNSNSILVGVS